MISRKYKLLNPTEPNEIEFPTKPFGCFRDLNGLGDDQSLAGSVRLRINDQCSIATSKTSEAGSQADLRSLSIYDNVSINESIEAASSSKQPVHSSSRLSNYSDRKGKLSPVSFNSSNPASAIKSSPIKERAGQSSPSLSETIINRDIDPINGQIQIIKTEIQDLNSNFEQKINQGDEILSANFADEKLVVNTNKRYSFDGVTSESEMKTSSQVRITTVSTSYYSKRDLSRGNSATANDVTVIGSSEIAPSPPSAESESTVTNGSSTKTDSAPHSTTESLPPLQSSRIRIYVPYQNSSAVPSNDQQLSDSSSNRVSSSNGGTSLNNASKKNKSPPSSNGLPAVDST